MFILLGGKLGWPRLHFAQLERTVLASDGAGGDGLWCTYNSKVRGAGSPSEERLLFGCHFKHQRRLPQKRGWPGVPQADRTKKPWKCTPAKAPLGDVIPAAVPQVGHNNQSPTDKPGPAACPRAGWQPVTRRSGEAVPWSSSPLLKNNKGKVTEGR